MKHLQTFITLAIGMVFPCLATTYTSASYVQDGLITQWDGIDNSGTGGHRLGRVDVAADGTALVYTAVPSGTMMIFR